MLVIPFIRGGHEGLFAQRWQRAGDSCYSVGSIFLTDTVHNRVYCSGPGRAPGCSNYSFGQPASNCYGFSYWNGTTWVTMGDSLPAECDRRPLCFYHDTLISNYFYLNYLQQSPPGNGSAHDSYIGKWNGTTWIRSLADSMAGYSTNFKVINNRLYTATGPNIIGGVKIYDVAYKDSLGWHALDTTTWAFNYGLVEMEEYNGSIYICGNFKSRDGTIRHFAKWNGTSWCNVGGNMFTGNFDAPTKLCKYQGYLYVGGYFGTAMGDPGNGIARWNDTTWEQLGTGLTDSVGNPGQVNDMKVINGKLIIAGGFSFANGLSSIDLTEWDGTKFCSFGASFDNAIYGIAGFGSEILFAGPSHVYDLVAGNTLAICWVGRWTGGSYRAGCSASVGIKQYANSSKQVAVYPNPTTGILYINLSAQNAGNMQVRITDVNGRVLINNTYTANAGGTNSYTLDISSLENGVYAIAISDDAGNILKQDKVILAK